MHMPTCTSMSTYACTHTHTHSSRYSWLPDCHYPPPPPPPSRNPWLPAVIAVACVLLIALVVGPLLPYFCFSPIPGGRPIWVQQGMQIKKRLLGEPREGPCSVVVTDIEGYTGEQGGGN